MVTGIFHHIHEHTECQQLCQVKGNWINLKYVHNLQDESDCEAWTWTDVNNQDFQVKLKRGKSLYSFLILTGGMFALFIHWTVGVHQQHNQENIPLYIESFKISFNVKLPQCSGPKSCLCSGQYACTAGEDNTIDTFIGVTKVKCWISS